MLDRISSRERGGLPFDQQCVQRVQLELCVCTIQTESPRARYFRGNISQLVTELCRRQILLSRIMKMFVKNMATYGFNIVSTLLDLLGDGLQWSERGKL